MTPSVRTRVSAGLATGLVTALGGAAVVAPGIGTPSVPAVMTLSSAAVELTAALQPLLQPGAAAEASAAAAAFVGADATEAAQSAGDWIINAYYAIQPWVEYGVQLFAWAFEWLPWPIGLLAPQAYIVYGGWQPFAESVAFSLAFLVDGEFDLVLPTLAAGIQTGLSNLVQGEIAWILSFFPPLPPIGFAAATAPAGRSAARVPAAPEGESNGEAPASDTPAANAAVSDENSDNASADPGATTTEGTATEAENTEAENTEAENTEALATETELADAEPTAAADPSPRRASRAQRPAPAASAAAAVEEVSVAATDVGPAATSASAPASASASATQQGSASRPAVRASRSAAVKQRDKAPGTAAAKSAGRR